MAIDGTETTGSVTGGTGAGAPNVADQGSVTADWAESGFTDNVAYSGAIRTNLCHNMRLYYGTSGSC